MLAHLITEPALSVAGPLDATLDPVLEPDGFLAPLAYEAALGWEDAVWVPARRRTTAWRADVLAWRPGNGSPRRLPQPGDARAAGGRPRSRRSTPISRPLGRRRPATPPAGSTPGGRSRAGFADRPRARP